MKMVKTTILKSIYFNESEKKSRLDIECHQMSFGIYWRHQLLQNLALVSVPSTYDTSNKSLLNEKKKPELPTTLHPLGWV